MDCVAEQDALQKRQPLVFFVLLKLYKGQGQVDLRDTDVVVCDVAICIAEQLGFCRCYVKCRRSIKHEDLYVVECSRNVDNLVCKLCYCASTGIYPVRIDSSVYFCAVLFLLQRSQVLSVAYGHTSVRSPVLSEDHLELVEFVLAAAVNLQNRTALSSQL